MKRPPIPHIHLPHPHQPPLNQSPPNQRRRVRKLLLGAVAMFVVATVSAWLALLVTPAQTVSTAGQTIQVGAAEPTLALAGPGELDLFGQSMPTVLQLDGLWSTAGSTISSGRR